MLMNGKPKRGKSVIRNVNTGKSGIFMGFRKRDDGRIVVMVRYDRKKHPIAVNAANCMIVTKDRSRNFNRVASSDPRLSAVTDGAAEAEYVRDPDCRFYDGCLSAVAKYKDVRLSCDVCSRDHPVDEEDCRRLSGLRIRESAMVYKKIATPKTNSGRYS